MDIQKTHYCFMLSERQMEFLRSKKYKIDRMECFMSLVTLAERETKLVPVSKTQQVEIMAGQCMADNTQLARLWDKDRKTVPKLLEAMEAEGISSSQKVGENRIHTLRCLMGWYIDGRLVKNPFADRRNADGTAIVRMDIPAAKVVTIEAEDTANKDTDNTVSGNAKSAPATGGNVSSFGGSPIASPSLSNGNAVDAKSRDDTISSAPSSDRYFHQSDSCQSADATSSSQEAAEGKLSGETLGVRPSWQSGGSQPQPNGTTDSGYKPTGNT